MIVIRIYQLCCVYLVSFKYIKKNESRQLHGLFTPLTDRRTVPRAEIATSKSESSNEVVMSVCTIEDTEDTDLNTLQPRKHLLNLTKLQYRLLKFVEETHENVEESS